MTEDPLETLFRRHADSIGRQAHRPPAHRILDRAGVLEGIPRRRRRTRRSVVVASVLAPLATAAAATVGIAYVPGLLSGPDEEFVALPAGDPSPEASTTPATGGEGRRAVDEMAPVLVYLVDLEAPRTDRGCSTLTAVKRLVEPGGNPIASMASATLEGALPADEEGDKVVASIVDPGLLSDATVDIDQAAQTVTVSVDADTVAPGGCDAIELRDALTQGVAQFPGWSARLATA